MHQIDKLETLVNRYRLAMQGFAVFRQRIAHNASAPYRRRLTEYQIKK
jgi:hypothetical protein